MRQHVSRRFWVFTVLAFASCILGLVTLISQAWIETLLGIDPDRGSGALEWMIVAALFASTFIAGALALREWKLASASI